jgi:hypothetical protein
MHAAVLRGGAAMTDRIDPVELADELAEVARTTTDAATGARLIKIVKRLLENAGLSPDHEDGGGDLPPTPLASETACRPA